MLSLKLVRSLVFGDTITDPCFLNHFYRRRREETHRPFLLFLPTQEIIFDAYKLANLARDIGMDFSPDPSLSTIIFSWSSLSSPLSSTTQVSLPFPDLSCAPLSQLQKFLRLCRGFFKLVSCKDPVINDRQSSSCSLSLFVRLTGNRVDGFSTFARILAGVGWTFYKSTGGGGGGGGGDVVHLFRKLESRKAKVGGSQGNSRIRELRLPDFDFGDVPVRILHYILLMTDDVFYLG